MSKISDRLTKLGQVERTGFGFGTHATGTKIPVILVGVRIDRPGDAGGLSADLFILAPDSTGAAQTNPVKGVDLWGVAISGGSGDEIDLAIKAGADFVVVEDESAPGAALNDDEVGRGLVIANEVSDDRARAIDSSPFDFLIVDGSPITLPLSVGATLDIQEQLARYSRHIFLKLAEPPEKSDLEILRDMGVSALIYDSVRAGKVDLAGLRETIDKLEPKKTRSLARAVLPRGGKAVAEQEDDVSDPDEPDEDEDWE
ncbi:MAG: hypothetical protein O6922_04895 [Chloroflexi bacterium]|nr:hypothetical protein [Chloroflexota bacterium]